MISNNSSIDLTSPETKLKTIAVEKIPQELRDKAQWVCRKEKIPYHPRGWKASSANRESWSHLDDVMAAFNAGGFTGIGFQFDNDFIGVDTDYAIDPATGELKSWAREIVDRLPTYWEISPSGKGLHGYVRGRIPEGLKGTKKAHGDGALEMYSSGRYFTVTGNHLPGTPTTIEDCSEEAMKLYGEINPPEAVPNDPAPSPGARDFDIDERLVRALGNAKFKKLFDGDWAGDYPSHSEADSALTWKLAYWFGRDATAMDIVFRRSKLWREKWDRVGPDLIQNAIIRVKDVYTPKVATVANLDAAVSICEDPEFFDGWHDEFLQRMLTGNPPREWTDNDDLELTLRVQREKDLAKMAVETMARAATVVAYRNKKNGLRDWMNSLKWDKVDRLETFFADYFGTEQNEYTRKVGLNFWISMVARTFKPGCQVDYVVVLEGAQGIRKSSALRVIGGGYFAEQHESVKSKDFYVNLLAKLVIEIAELHAFKNEIEKVKMIVTTTVDTYRGPYERRATDHPRRCVFVGTTNRSDWQKDETGGRRFWPIACGSQINVDGIATNRDQFFAEAVHRFNAGETWWEMPEKETLAQQADRYTAPAWAQKIERYITHKPDTGTGPDFEWMLREKPLTELTVADVLENALKMGSRWSKADEMRVGEALTFLKWEKRRIRKDGVRPWIWYPKEVSPDLLPPAPEVGPK